MATLMRHNGIIRIMAYSLPDMDYVTEQIGRRPRGVYLIANSKFRSSAEEVAKAFPLVHVAVHEKMHSKVLLGAPHTVIVSSANFGSSKMHETTMSVHSEEAHDYYAKNFALAWSESEVLG